MCVHVCVCVCVRGHRGDSCVCVCVLGLAGGGVVSAHVSLRGYGDYILNLSLPQM